MRGRIIRYLFILAVGLLCLPGMASAQASRTWVSGTGDDANPCSRTAPCKTFAGAISKTAASGEISVLDPSGYGALTITKAITINALGVEGSVLVSGTDGIRIQAAGTDAVTLRGISFEGLGTGLNGINVVSAGRVEVLDCVIRGFSQSGILVQSSTPLQMFMRNSVLIQNATGLTVLGSTTMNAVGLENSSLSENPSGAIALTGSNALLYLLDSAVLGPPSITVTGSPTIYTFGNNYIAPAVAASILTPLARQ